MDKRRDNSREAQDARVTAVEAVACPKCKRPAGSPCKASGGGSYNPRYDIHAARMAAAYGAEA